MNWNIFFKVTTGIFVVPICICAHYAWPAWASASLPIKVIAAPVVIPLGGAAAVLMPWWEKL